jgi:hypothetical protein
LGWKVKKKRKENEKNHEPKKESKKKKRKRKNGSCVAPDWVRVKRSTSGDVTGF